MNCKMLALIIPLTYALLGCDSSTFNVDFKTDPRILRGQWKAKAIEQLGLSNIVYNAQQNLLAGLNHSSIGDQLVVVDAATGQFIGGSSVGWK